jgi:23S rRNA (cytosine1962-C5)-methyltransferase
VKTLRIKRGQERHVTGGSLWAFSNQIDASLRDYEPGEIIHLTTRNGRFLGTGYVNPHSLIAVRLLSREEVEIDAEFFHRRLKWSQQLRRKILPGEDAVREVFSESDLLPGLIVDRYGSILVTQIATAGMARLKGELIQALQEVYQPDGIYERSDLGVRKLEGLEESVGLLHGQVPEDPIWLKYEGLSLPVDVRRGQKTGLYLDQRRNLDFIVSLAHEARVLDLFSYTGAWGLKAARAGAAQVTFLDSSEWALEQVQKAARRNRVAGACTTLKGTALDTLKKLVKQKQKYDVLVLDPPSFIKSKSRFKEGYKGYFDLNQRALELIAPGGFLITSSCSHHMLEATYLELMRSVLRQSGRDGRLLYRGLQGPDHPVHPSMLQTEYLHCFVLQIS